MEVPVASSLDQVYQSDSLLVQGKRWNNLLERFNEKYGAAAEFVSRSPGRVNIIGEVCISLLLHSRAPFGFAHRHRFVKPVLTRYSILITLSMKCYQWLWRSMYCLL